MNNTKDILFGTWQERNAQAYQQWGRFSINDLSLPDSKTGEVDVLFRQYRDRSPTQLKAQVSTKPGYHDHNRPGPGIDWSRWKPLQLWS